MTNPLIDKYNELKKKKEEPKKVELDGTITLSKEQMDIVSKYLTDPKNYSTTSVTSVTTSNSSAITASDAYSTSSSSSFKTYDYDSGKDSFLQTAEKVKNGEAQVISVSIVNDIMGSFSTGMKTVTFEVRMWDT